MPFFPALKALKDGNSGNSTNPKHETLHPEKTTAGTLLGEI